MELRRVLAFPTYLTHELHVSNMSKVVYFHVLNTKKGKTCRVVKDGIFKMACRSVAGKFEGWKTIQGKFAMVWAINVTHCTSDNFTAPRAQVRPPQSNAP
jgi:hypothetical protein